MARGKHAIAAAHRQTEARDAHIDRLTTELAEAKIRARDAEARAARLEGVERLLDATSQRNDELLTTTLEKLAEWREIAKADGRRRRAAMAELSKLVRDVCKGAPAGPEDIRQFMVLRYPAILCALCVMEPEGLAEVMPNRNATPTERKFTDEQLRRFQRLYGERTVLDGNPDIDTAKVLCDLLDAKQAGFSVDEAVQYAVPNP